MILEYLPFGDLEYQHIQRCLSGSDVLLISRQSLSALEYLHQQTPPLVHRDIKPENMLVQSRDPMHIKLSDFGLSKESDYMNTCCGTKTYAAPEIYRSSSESYSKRVDIWSLGVVIFQYGYGLPKPGYGGGVEWCEQIVRKLHDWESDDMIDILTGSMLVMKPKARASVSICLEQVMQIPIPSSYGQPKYHAVFGSECETTVPYDYGVLGEFEPTIPDDHTAMRDRETIGQTYQQATQIYRPHEYTGRTNSSAKRSNRPHELFGQRDQSLRLTPRPDESKKYHSETSRDSEIEEYIRASNSPFPDAATTRKRDRSTESSRLISTIGEPAHRGLADEVYDPTIRLSTNEFLGFQRTNSFQLNRDSEIQRYISTKAPHESTALIITEKRKRLQAPSSTSSKSSGRRRKKSYAPTLSCSTSVANSQSHCFRDSEIDKYIIPTSIAQPSHEAPEATLDLFGEGWLKDANCVGSSVAELWNSESELSSYTSRKCSSRESAVVTSQDTNANTTELAFVHQTSSHQGSGQHGQVCNKCDGKSLCRACAREGYANEDLEVTYLTMIHIYFLLISSPAKLGK